MEGYILETDLNEFVNKVESLNIEKDLSRDEDLGIALMHLVSLEEHFYFTAMKTGQEKYLEMLDEVRDLRRDFMKRIVKNPLGEEWCISKHLLGSSMRLLESGSKEKASERKPYYQAAFELFSLFFAINITKSPVTQESTGDVAESNSSEKKESFLKRAGTLFKSLVDCCRE